MTFQPTLADLERMFPRPRGAKKRAIWESYIAALTSPEVAKLLEAFEITTPRRWHALLGTWSVETGDLTIFWESGAYSADGIVRVFGPGKHSARVTAAEARKLAGDGPALFERVYGLGNPPKAKALGNCQPGDGWRFRGMGPAQLTGRWAHEKYARELSCSLDDLCTPTNALHAALREWRDKKCNLYADKADWVSVRKLINAGSLKVPTARLNGLAHAVAASERASAIWPTLVPQVDLTPKPVPAPAPTEVVPDVADAPIAPELEPKPVPQADVTTGDLVGQSRKITLLVRFKNFLAWMGLGGGTAVTFADITDNKETLSYVASVISHNPLLTVVAILIIIGICGYIMAHFLIRWHLEDARDGRYVPRARARDAA